MADFSLFGNGSPDYFDFEKFGRDMELGGDVWTADAPGGVYVFTSH